MVICLVHLFLLLCVISLWKHTTIYLSILLICLLQVPLHTTAREFFVKCESEMKVTQSRPTLWDHMDYSLPGSSVSGILQARIPEWVTIPFSRGSSQPRNRTGVSCIAGRFFTLWATREAPCKCKFTQIISV